MTDKVRPGPVLYACHNMSAQIPRHDSVVLNGQTSLHAFILTNSRVGPFSINFSTLSTVRNNNDDDDVELTKFVKFNKYIY